MRKPYSLDLKEKALALVAKNMSKEEVAKLLEVGRDTVFRWAKRKRETGSLVAKPIKGRTPKITDLENFKKFVDENKNLTQEEMARKYGSVSKDAIGRTLRKIGYSRKKRVIYIPKEMK
jgi:transposase